MHLNLDDIFKNGRSRSSHQMKGYKTAKGTRSRSVLRSKDHFIAGPTWFIKVVVSRKKKADHRVGT
jgi:hypothetical protein